ncbi:MAG TPA: ferritin family protein [Candidatus Deferrimicrobiaceae bacterium]|jgi:rubrerythrin|nr:ferritin family protein [Candidatus Deferrimicrobiaceae bacterium]
MPETPDSFDRVVEQCILMEIQAMSLYTTLANRVEDEETARVLRYLAEMEESHVGRLVEIFPEAKEDAEKALSHVEIVKAFRSEAWRMHKARLAGAGLTETSPLDDYLTFAIVSEAHARSRYERLSAEAGDPLAEEIFRTLSREESAHEEQLKRIQKSFREKR